MKKVFVGLSGGVDSAVSAALLKEQGFDVTGVFIKIWQPEFLECTWKEDRLDAMRVAASLSIPFREIDLSAEYKRGVIDDMITSYKNGITPNPDVLCNRIIKFGAFAQWARDEGAEYIATGHYARVERSGDMYSLLRGADPNKDQTYFLHMLTPQDLAQALFPVGHLRKSEVRSLAEKFELPVSKRPDSQGLCFVGDISIDEFLSRFIPLHVGEVRDASERVIGTHQGAAMYTTGQRHGFLVHSGMPHYITRVDTANNVVYASSSREDAASSHVEVAAMHWIEKPASRSVSVQTRYREAPFSVTLAHDDAVLRATFATPRVVSLGQSLVLYDDERCLGGGALTAASM